MKEIKYPSDWQSVILGDICYVNKNSLSEKTPKDYNFKYIDLSAVDRGKIQLSNQYIAFKDAPCRARRIIYRDDIIMSTVRPNLQGFAFVDFDSNDIICSTGFAVLTAKEQTSNKYIYQLLYSKEIETQIKNMLVGSNYPAINSSDVASLKIFLPPLAEQKKIAEILETWDRVIEELTGLIAEKKELKRGLMQRLLTGTQRLPGFTKTWKKTKLHDVAEISKGTQLNRLNMLEEGYPVYNGGMIESGFTNEYNNGADTIIISEGGNSCGFVNFIKTKFWAGGHCYTVFCRDCVNKSFLYQLLKYNENKLMNLRVGSGLPNIQQKALNKFPLLLPNDLAEQKAIADILSKADSEIDLLNQQLDVLKEQKRGLMQKLLTGEIRVKVDTETC